MRRTIGSSVAAYSNKKRDIIKSIGFDDGFLTGTISFGGDVSWHDIVDVQIGLRETLDVSHFSTKSVRFGIASKFPNIEREKNDHHPQIEY